MMSIRYVVLSLLAFCLTGCGDAPEKPKFAANLVPVTGAVTWNGQPLVGATVRFLASGRPGGGETAEAVTDAEGKYALQTMMANASVKERLGAVPASYKVQITRIVLPNGNPAPPETTEADALAEGAIQQLPFKYSHPEATILQQVVKAEPNVIDFKLVK